MAFIANHRLSVELSPPEHLATKLLPRQEFISVGVRHVLANNNASDAGFMLYEATEGM